jgi:hypothetical protein
VLGITLFFTADPEAIATELIKQHDRVFYAFLWSM